MVQKIATRRMKRVDEPFTGQLAGLQVDTQAGWRVHNFWRTEVIVGKCVTVENVRGGFGTH